MRFGSITNIFRKVARLGTAGFMVLTIASCGGGGGSPGSTGTGSDTGSDTGTTTSQPTITLALFDTNGVSTTSVTTASPMTARATVVDAAGVPLANTIVTFATGGTLTTLTPSSGTALTNASGVATITVAPINLATAQSEAGAADTVTAAVTIDEETFVDSAPYTLGATAITLSLVTPSPSTINLDAYATTPISVDVFADGVLYTAQPVTVNFTSACASATKADLPASASTVNGRAQVVYRDNGCSATDVVTASVAGAQPVTANLVVAAPVAASIRFVSATPSDKAIVIQGAGGNGRSETAILTFQALDTFGQPLPNQLVTFAVNSTESVSLQSTSATTDTNGNVVVAVNSGTLPTTFRVIATLPTAQSTISDTITVTTGQPVQAAFSLSAESFNIEGWDLDNEQTSINILMADQSGNPVADGTPVVFQTDSGAVGSSLIGGCVTTNGGCSVNFRSQAPRFGIGNSAGKRAGMATINVSSTTALVTLSGQIAVFLSGSEATNVRLHPSGTIFAPGDTFATTSCSNYYLALEVNDENFNPMPFGTTIAVANADNVSVGTITPATVPSVAPHDTSGAGTVSVGSLAARQGSVHVIPVKPDASCVEGGAGTATGTFDLVITSPSGVVTSYTGIGLTYPK